MYEVDEEEQTPKSLELRETLAILFAPDDVAELRMLPKTSKDNTWSGYYDADNRDKMALDAAKYDGHIMVCAALNPVLSALLARSPNYLTEKPTATTSDAEIVKRKWLFVDFDPRRPSGVSSSDPEKGLAHECATGAQDWLKEEYGWPAPVFADSGNGFHCCWPIDLANTPESTELLKRVLLAISGHCGTEAVDVDKSVFNAARLIKLWGTKAIKGNSIPERPHRTSSVLSVPAERTLVTKEQLEAVAALAPAPVVPPSKHAPRKYKNADALPVLPAQKTETGIDLAAWINEFGITVDRIEIEVDGSTRYHLAECPFDSSHGFPGSSLIQFGNGAIGFKCFHNTCQSRKWQDVRVIFEPNAYDHQNRPEVQTNNRQLRDVAADTLDALLKANHPARIFVRDGELVDIQGSEQGAVICTMDKTSLRNYATKSADFVEITIRNVRTKGVKSKKIEGDKIVDVTPETKPEEEAVEELEIVRRAVFPPLDVMSGLLKTCSDVGLPELDYVSLTPLVSRAGTLEATPGYLAGARAYYYNKDVDAEYGVQNPMQKHVDTALHFFKNELLFGFPFDCAASYAHTLAAIVEPLMRPYINAPVPGKMIEASAPASGKTLLAETIAAITCPVRVNPSPPPKGEEEWRKKLTSSLLNGPQFVWIDNIEGTLRSDALCVAMSNVTWSDRRLGETEDLNLPIRCQFLLTANNVVLHYDITTRCVLIRLDAKMEHPEERTGWKIASPPAYVRDHREEVLGHVCNLVRYWISKGRPEYTGDAVTRFGRWTAVMGGFLECIGVAGFLRNRKDLMLNATEDVDVWKGFVCDWWKKHQNEKIKIGTLCDLAFGRIIGDTRQLNEGKLSGQFLAKDDDERMMKFAKVLSKYRDRVFAQFAIRYVHGRHTEVWLEITDEAHYEQFKAYKDGDDYDPKNREGAGHWGSYTGTDEEPVKVEKHPDETEMFSEELAAVVAEEEIYQPEWGG